MFRAVKLTEEQRDELADCQQCSRCTVCNHEPCPVCVDDCDHHDCLVQIEGTDRLEKTHVCQFKRCDVHKDWPKK